MSTSFLQFLLIYGTYCTFVLLQPSGKNCVRGSGEFVGNVRNVTVKVLQDEPGFESDTDLHKSLKLNVSWLPPDGNKRPSSYSVVVTSVPKGANTTECLEESLFYTTSNDSQLHVLLPETSISVDMPELHVRPNCSYRVEVYANPRMKPTAKLPEVIYTVPECVGRRCSCANAEKTLPIPEVNVVQEEEFVSVNWTVISRDPRVRSYAISVGRPLLTSRNGLPVYNFTKIGSVPAAENAFRWDRSSNSEILELKTGDKILVQALDDRGCSGTEGSYVIRSVEFYSNFEDDANIWLIIVGAVAVCVLFGVLSFAAFNGKRKLLPFPTASSSRIRRISTHKCQWAESVLQKRNILYVQTELEEDYADDTDKFEVPYKSVSLIRELGKGQFGKVYLGCLDNASGTLVAVKTSQCRDSFNESETRLQFTEEIAMMKAAGSHQHLVGLVGYCTRPDKPVCIILEYMEGGDLLAFLHSRRRSIKRKAVRDDQNSWGHTSGPSISETLYTTIISAVSSTSGYGLPQGNTCSYKRYVSRYVNVSGEDRDDRNEEVDKIDRRLFLKFATDIAKGMKHLETKAITHRDLAARNILLSSDSTLKISDFGLSRNGTYVIDNVGGKARHLPIRWMSPEALRDRAFTSKSDVWSFGVVLWEIGSLGAFPYCDIRDDRLLGHVVREEGRLERPEGVPVDVYQIMQSCWANEPEDRPNFAWLVSELNALFAPPKSETLANNPCYGLPV